MKEKDWLETLETQLASWQPRPPAASLKRRLFRAPDAGHELVRLMNWLAPAAVCMVVALAALKQENGLSSDTAHNRGFMAMVLSNRSDVAYLPGGSSQIEQNVLPATFEWTNHNNSNSTIGFTPSTKSND